MRAARDVFPEVGCEERKLEVLQVLLLFDVIFLYNFWGYMNLRTAMMVLFMFLFSIKL